MQCLILFSAENPHLHNIFLYIYPGSNRQIDVIFRILKYQIQTPCNIFLFFSKKKESVCKNYGLNFIHSTKNGVILRNESVCTTSEKLHGIIETGQFAMVEFWYFHQLNYNADCYFWCNSEEDFVPTNVISPAKTLVKKAGKFKY